MTHYYHLTGRVGQIHNLLSAPMWHASIAWEDAFDNPSVSMIYKVGNFTKAVFLILLGLPLHGMAYCLQRAYREQIPNEIYRKEFAAWKEKDKGMFSNSFLECLVAAHLKASDCPYKLLFTARWRSGNTKGLLGSLDGHFSSCTPLINGLKTGEALLIYFPESRAARAEMISRHSYTQKGKITNPIPPGLGDPYSYRMKESLIPHGGDVCEDRLHVLWLDHEPIHGNDPYTKRFIEVMTAKRA